MKVHIGSDEKFSSGLFARLEFLHSHQVVFQIKKQRLCSGSASLLGGELSFFVFPELSPSRQQR